MKRGRKSAAELSVVSANFDRRPAAPEELTERQRQIWDAVVSSEPADFFRGAAQQAMLADFCRHRESIEMICETINIFQAKWLRSEEGATRYRDLLKIRDSETRAASQLATKLRITNQSRYTPQAAGTAARNNSPGKKPWEL